MFYIRSDNGYCVEKIKPLKFTNDKDKALKFSAIEAQKALIQLEQISISTWSIWSE